MKQYFLLWFLLGFAFVGIAQNKRFNLPGLPVDTAVQNQSSPSGQDNNNTSESTPKKEQPKPAAPKETFWDRAFTGGGFGLAFGNITNINLSPQLGYRVTDNFSVGVGATYIFYNNQFFQFTTHIYGGRVFARYRVWRGLFLHVENEMLNLEAFDQLNNRVWTNSVMAGAGYQQSLGGNSSLFVMGLFNFTESKYTPYTNPVIRFGFNIGL